jgi:hypothetical protein
MSDLGYLSYQQQRASDLARRLERALAEVDAERLTLQSRQWLALSLQPLVDVLNPLAAQDIDPERVLGVPIGVVELLRAQVFHGRPYASALADLVTRLPAGDQPLEAEERELIADVAGAAESAAAKSYRSMVRW